VRAKKDFMSAESPSVPLVDTTRIYGSTLEDGQFALSNNSNISPTAEQSDENGRSDGSDPEVDGPEQQAAGRASSRAESPTFEETLVIRWDEAHADGATREKITRLFSTLKRSAHEDVMFLLENRVKCAEDIWVIVQAKELRLPYPVIDLNELDANSLSQKPDHEKFWLQKWMEVKKIPIVEPLSYPPRAGDAQNTVVPPTTPARGPSSNRGDVLASPSTNFSPMAEHGIFGSATAGAAHARLPELKVSYAMATERPTFPGLHPTHEQWKEYYDNVIAWGEKNVHRFRDEPMTALMGKLGLQHYQELESLTTHPDKQCFDRSIKAEMQLRKTTAQWLTSTIQSGFGPYWDAVNRSSYGAEAVKKIPDESVFARVAMVAQLEQQSETYSQEALFNNPTRITDDLMKIARDQPEQTEGDNRSEFVKSIMPKILNKLAPEGAKKSSIGGKMRAEAEKQLAHVQANNGATMSLYQLVIRLRVLFIDHYEEVKRTANELGFKIPAAGDAPGLPCGATRATAGAKHSRTQEQQHSADEAKLKEGRMADPKKNMQHMWLGRA
jgi:hypothetical protein